MSIDDLADAIRKPAIEFRPELRWWLAEGLHTDETLRREIDTAHRLGFGGLEFLAMDEEAIDHGRYGWGSEEWVHDSQIVVEETTRRGMSVSFTSGTNWSNANLPDIGTDHPAAAQELDVVTEDLGPDGRHGAVPRIDLTQLGQNTVFPGEHAEVHEQQLLAVVAAPIRGQVGGTVDDGTGTGVVIDPAEVVDLTSEIVDGDLDWTPPTAGDDVSWRLFAFWIHGTGQTASPSASVNYTVNYLERAGVDAVIDYWRDVVLTPELRAAMAGNDRAQMYMDSLELSAWGRGGLLWGPSVATEFRERRGYDLTPWLPFLPRSVFGMVATTVYENEPVADRAVDVAKVRFDVVRTLTDLYIENMLRPFAAFLHEHGILLRSEISYGLPFELTRPGPEVDGIETESLEFGSQIDAYRLLAGPAHLFGKQYSSETGATTRNHMLDHRFYDQIIATQLAAGITKTVLHGWASQAGAEGATHWPGHEGMWPMFSERFDTRQPGSAFYPLWNDAIGRLQLVLRRGRPRIDVGILRTDHFTDNMAGFAFADADGERILDEDAYGRMWMRDRDNDWWQDLGMQDAGWTYEFLDGTLLQHPDVTFADGLVQPGGPGYQALIVFQDALDPDVARHLLEWARRGLRVLVVHGAREVKLRLRGEYHEYERAAARTQGLDGRDDELAATVRELLAQPSVAEVGSPAETVDALRALGVTGRAEFTAENRSVLSHLRDDGDLMHAYLYHFLYETGEETEVEVALPGEGAVFRVDPWSGSVLPHAAARSEDGRTLVTVRLRPGEVALLTLDQSVGASTGSAGEGAGSAAGGLGSAGEGAGSAGGVTVDGWTLTVESWDAGEPEVITEDRGLGYVSREVRPTTAVTELDAGAVELLPWKDLAAIGPEVSGIGVYRAVVELPAASDGERVLLDLGSTAGGLGSVRVNGSEPRGFDTSAPIVDITGLVVAGVNELEVRVSSSLNNRLRARGYYDDLPDIARMLLQLEPGPHVTRVRDHGLLGPVVVRTTT